MTEVQPKHPPRDVTVTVTFFINKAWIEEQVIATGQRHADRWVAEINLRDVEDPSERRLLRDAHAFYKDHPDYPLLSQPTEDVHELIAALAEWVEGIKASGYVETSEEAFEREKDNWIRELGSPALRQAHERNYKINRTYALERARLEYPSSWVDTSDGADWAERGDPTAEALTLETEVARSILENGHNYECRIVWLTEPPRDLADYLDERDEAFEADEAVIVYEYLGRYALVIPVDADWRKPAPAQDDE